MSEIQTTEIDRQLRVIENGADGAPIATEDQYLAEGERLLRVREAGKALNGIFDDAIASAHKTHKAIINAKRPYSDRLMKIEDAIKNRRKAWRQEQDRIQAALQEKANAKARKEEEDRILEVAQRLEDEGKHKAAAAILDEEVVPPPVVLPRAVPKQKGLSETARWLWRVVDQRLIPETYKKLDTVMIGQIVRAQKGATRIPGIEVYSETGERISA